MPGFTSRDDLINEITVNGKQDTWNFYKIAPATPEVTGGWQSLWAGVGSPGAGGTPATTPGTSYASDQASAAAGAIWFPDRSPDLRYLLSFGAVSTQNCTLMLYDRLVAVSGISLASTGSKTVNSGALDRYTGTDAILNEVWLELTADATTTVPVVNIDSYTTADGTTGQSGGAVTFPGTAPINNHSFIPLPLSATKRGVRSVESINVVTAAAAGTCNVVILRPLARIPLAAGQWNEISLLDDSMGLPRIFDNASLALALMAGPTSASNVFGTINCAYG